MRPLLKFVVALVLLTLLFVLGVFLTYQVADVVVKRRSPSVIEGITLVAFVILACGFSGFMAAEIFKFVDFLMDCLDDSFELEDLGEDLLEPSIAEDLEDEDMFSDHIRHRPIARHPQE